jgi:hypothetical protein
MLELPMRTDLIDQYPTFAFEPLENFLNFRRHAFLPLTLPHGKKTAREKCRTVLSKT